MSNWGVMFACHVCILLGPYIKCTTPEHHPCLASSCMRSAPLVAITTHAEVQIRAALRRVLLKTHNSVVFFRSRRA